MFRPVSDDMKIQILGAKEFRRQLAAAGSQLPREVRKVLNASAHAVKTEAARTVPRRSGDLARSIRARSTMTEGRVVMGKKAVAYAGFIEFGGRVGKGRSVSRPYVPDGRYLYPAYLRRRVVVLAAMEAGLRTLKKTMEK